MKIRRQKIFVAPLMPLLTAGTIGMTGAQMKQSSDQAEEAEAQNRQQVKALNRLAKAAENNPGAAQQIAAEVVKQKQASKIDTVLPSQKEFAGVNPQTLNNAKGFAKDMWKFAKTQKGKFGGYLLGGAGLAAGAAVADKVIQKDIKKNNLPFLDQQEQAPRAFSQKPTTSIVKMEHAGAAASNLPKKQSLLGKVWKHTPVGMMAFGAMTPTMSYMADKKQYQDMIGSTSQKEFATFGNIGSMAKNAGQWIKGRPASIGRFWKNVGKTKGGNVLDWSAKNLGGMERQGMTDSIKKIGQESNNQWTKNVGNFLEKHPKSAAAGALALGGGMMSVGFGQGEKLTKKAIKQSDPNAFAYQESKEKQVPQQ